ncbi:hypothetical protein DVB69_13135 [Sporosarcina sp. BI001-red]|uniref:hypothetical protein n=1 Tax=Sporosarcina sp. BI001-red TaxID=2282866 RepID=UPI000E231647|nr:hypothetical protein [Sporosarcina sp. BI001-red]REB06631.1 hypothetical protein DVB69_13135 [Sporosarcina sp. BI001-red]
MLPWEIKKILRNNWGLPAVLAVFGFWSVMIYFAAQKSPAQVLATANSFWHVLGTLSIGFLILAMTAKIFILDKEEGVKEVILTARHGRTKVFLTRLGAAGLCALFMVLLLTAIQLAGAALAVSPGEFTEVVRSCAASLPYVLAGSVLFSIFAACVCAIFQSHTSTVILCGLLYGLTFLLRGKLLTDFSIEWFLEKGFFSYAIRSNEITDEPQLLQLVIWYMILIAGTVLLTRKLQGRRHEL